ncbi:MAG: S1 RNA-binding domain-containing protein [Deltaproteobacteria bacterium]|nr:S1 RNA-binding domain-containing protein [Deltaproteobacteria bacterium]
MTQPDNTDPNAPKPADAADAAQPSPETTTSSSEAANAAPAEEARPSNDAPEAEASAAEGGDEGDDGDGAEGEGGEAEGGAAAATGEGGAPAKKKRRRRRKKKPGAGATEGAEGAAAAEGGAEGAGAEGAGPQGEKRQKPKKDRPERERPAFNVGDVVFGKVLEVTEDALFVDLSGKAKAIFDLRELLITEEEAEEYNRAHKADRHEAQQLGETGEQPVIDASAEGAAEAAPAEGAGDADPGLEAATTEVSVPAAAAPEAPAAASEEPPVDSSEAPTREVELPTAAASGGDEKQPQLPRVILEPGAPFVGLVHNDGGRGGLVVLTHHPKRLSKTKPIAAEASRSGALVFGLVTGTIKGGVEVDVDGLRAFAPASHVELRPGADLSHLVGKRLPFAVTQYAKRGRDVVLSRRAMLEQEYKEKREKALENVKMGEVVDGVVRTVVPFGAFIDIGGVEGLVPLSEMSHNRADGPRDVFKVGETVKVKVLRVDEKGKLWLSRKAAIDDPWGQVAQKYAQGTKHTGKIVRLQPFGAFVELEPGIDGLIHAADLSMKRIEHPEEVVKVGQELEVVVASVDSRQHRIALHPAPTGDAANETPQRIQVGKSVKVVVVAIESNGLVVRILGATGRHARGFVSAAATGTPRGTELRKLFPVGKELDVKIVEMDPRRGDLKLSIKALNEETERNAYQQYRAQVKREAKFGTLADLLAKRNITPSK